MTAHGQSMPTQTDTAVDFHLPLPWYLDIDLATGHLVANTSTSEEQERLASSIVNLLAAGVQNFGGEVQYPSDRWSAWGTPAGRGHLRRFVVRLSEEHTQQFARLARLVSEQVLIASNQPPERAVVVTKAGDDTAVLF